MSFVPSPFIPQHTDFSWPCSSVKGENKIISGQREQQAAAGNRQADILENQAAAHRNRADALHPSGGI